MPDISKITLPSGSTYNIKDAQARSQIEALTGGTAIVFVGVSSTPLTDGGDELPNINGGSVMPNAGELYFYGTQEFIYGVDEKWHALGSLDSLGALAYKDDASTSYTPEGTLTPVSFTGQSSEVTITTTNDTNGNYQPAGTVTQPTFTGNTLESSGSFTPSGDVTVSIDSTENKTTTVSEAASGTTTYTPAGEISTPVISVTATGATETIHNPTKVTVAKTVVATAPGTAEPTNNITYYSVTNETLSLYQLGYTTGDSITTSDVTVKTGDATYAASTPTFTGKGARLVTGNIPVPASYTATFSGTEENIRVSGTPSGSVSQPTFTGTKVQLTGTTTPQGTVSQPTFTGTQTTITVE